MAVYSMQLDVACGGMNKSAAKTGGAEQIISERVQVQGNVTDYTSVVHTLGLMTAPKLIVVIGGPGISVKIGADATAIAAQTAEFAADPIFVFGEDVPLPTNENVTLAFANAHGQSQMIEIMAVE